MDDWGWSPKPQQQAKEVESITQGRCFHLADTFDVNSGQDILEWRRMQQVTHLL